MPTKDSRSTRRADSVPNARPFLSHAGLCKWQRLRWEFSRNAALCNSQGHRPWNTAQHYPFRFQAPTGRPEERPVGARKTCGSGATRCPRGDAPGYCRLGLWPTQQCCHSHNPAGHASGDRYWSGACCWHRIAAYPALQELPVPVESKPLFRPDVLRSHLSGFELPAVDSAKLIATAELARAANSRQESPA